ncbi:hypothetical protein FALCPG4_009004 [Fusarium falciforme]
MTPPHTPTRALLSLSQPRPRLPSAWTQASTRRDEGVPQILIRNNVPASCVSGPPMDIALSLVDGPGRPSSCPTSMAICPVLRWRRRLCSREISQLLHGSRQLTLSVAHPGSVNLDAGSPTACGGGDDLVPPGWRLIVPSPWGPLRDGSCPCPCRWLALIRVALHLLCHAMSGSSLLSGLYCPPDGHRARCVYKSICLSTSGGTMGHLSKHLRLPVPIKSCRFLSGPPVLWLAASPLTEPVLNKWFRSWTYWVTQPSGHPSPLACAS